jgi:hypothetical protein
MSYAVTVLAQPSAESCMVSGATGIVAGANATAVQVNCTPSPASVRVVNATTGSFSVVLNGTDSLAPAAPQGSTAFEPAPSGTDLAGFSSTDGAASWSGVFALDAAKNYTILGYEVDFLATGTALAEDLPLPAAGFANLAFANVSQGPGPLDVYVLPAGTATLSGRSPAFASVTDLSAAAQFAASDPAAMPPVAWNIWISAAGNPADLRAVPAGAELDSGNAYYLGLTGAAGAALVNAVLIPQGMAVPAGAYFPATQARVRLLSALPSSSQVALSLGTTGLTTSAPNPTSFALVGGGSTVTSIVVTHSGGPAFSPALPANVFAAVGDYSVLLFGDGTSAGGASAVVVTERNDVIPAFASVRVINGAVNAASGVTLDANAVPVGTGAAVAYGTASSYWAVAPVNGALLQVNGTGYSMSTSADLTGISVYEVFVYSASAAPLVIQER